MFISLSVWIKCLKFYMLWHMMCLLRVWYSVVWSSLIKLAAFIAIVMQQHTDKILWWDETHFHEWSFYQIKRCVTSKNEIEFCIFMNSESYLRMKQWRKTNLLFINERKRKVWHVLYSSNRTKIRCVIL